MNGEKPHDKTQTSNQPEVYGIQISKLDNSDSKNPRQPKGQLYEVPLAQDQSKIIQIGNMELAFRKALISFLKSYADVFVYAAKKVSRIDLMIIFCTSWPSKP